MPPNLCLVRRSKTITMTRRLLVVTAFCSLVGGAIDVAVAADSAASDVEQVRRLQSQLVDAYIRGNIAMMDGILADDFAFVDDDGVLLNKEQLLDFFRSGEDKVTSYKRTEDKVRIYGEVAILTYRCQIKETYKGQDVGGDFRITRIFVKRHGRWKMVGGQDTKISGSRPGAR